MQNIESVTLSCQCFRKAKRQLHKIQQIGKYKPNFHYLIHSSVRMRSLLMLHYFFLTVIMNLLVKV